MTDQERPVEERKELHDDLAITATVAVDEPEASEQESPAVDEQPEPAAQPTAAFVAEATGSDSAPTTTEERTIAPAAEMTGVYSVPDAPEATGADSVPDAPEVAAVAPVAEASTAAPVAEAESQAETAVVPEPPDATGGLELAVVPEPPEATGGLELAVVPEPPDATGGLEPAVVPEPPEATSSLEPAVVPEPPEATGSAESSTPEAAGASYVPPEEAPGGRPRRLKDLEPGMELEGRVTSIALYGIFVDIGVGRDGLVHISEMSDTRIESPSDIVEIGDTVKVRVKNVESDGRRISLTMRSRERGGEPRGRGRKRPDVNREALASLKVGDNVEGTITGIASFGVFVDLGVGKDGLVHVSELAEGRIDKPEDAVQVGQTYTFKILEVDSEGSRISLSLRRAQRGQRMQQLEKGQILEGTISGLAPFGAFVDIGVGRDGLVHISELSEGRIAKVEDAVKVGDKVTVRVLEVDSQSKRISLSLRLEDRPREEPAPRAEIVAEPREERSGGRREERGGRREERGGRREDRPRRIEEAPQPAADVYTSSNEPEEDFTGNATIEDLLSKFGGKRDRKRRQEEEEEDDEDRYTRRQRDAIRRTLQQMKDDE